MVLQGAETRQVNKIGFNYKSALCEESSAWFPSGPAGLWFLLMFCADRAHCSLLRVLLPLTADLTKCHIDFCSPPHHLLRAFISDLNFVALASSFLATMNPDESFLVEHVNQWTLLTPRAAISACVFFMMFGLFTTGHFCLHHGKTLGLFSCFSSLKIIKQHTLPFYLSHFNLGSVF